MDIVKNLKDYRLSHKQKVFIGFLKEDVSSYSCSEKITNKSYLRRYFAPENDFLIYCVGGEADPARLLPRKIV